MGRNASQPTILVLSQVYVPDPASVGQHMADAAEALAARGHSVRVLTSARGYDDPSQRYARRERRGGVEILRLPFSSFGKKTIALRLLGATFFLAQTIVRGLLTPRLGTILVSTSPPMCSMAAVIIGGLRRVPIKYWVMDLNPDQMILLGRVSQHSFAARAFDWMNRMILGRAEEVIVLDRFMAQRICRKRDVRHKLSVVPPWPHEDHLEPVAKDRNPFIAKHGLRDKRVVMYSGNHSIASPLSTLIDAALRLREDPRLVFMFIGGGLGKREVDEAIERHRPPNMISLPYQPLSEIKYSLSAADVHVASLGNTMVGVIHPCKAYGAMTVARPLLVFGPSPSHLSEIVGQHHIGWQVIHGDVGRAVECLREIAAMPAEQLQAMGRAARQVMAQQFRKELLCPRFCDIIERHGPERRQPQERPWLAPQPVQLTAAPAALHPASDQRPHPLLKKRRVAVLGGPGLLRRAVCHQVRTFSPAHLVAIPRRQATSSGTQRSAAALLKASRPEVVIDLGSAACFSWQRAEALLEELEHVGAAQRVLVMPSCRWNQQSQAILQSLNERLGPSRLLPLLLANVYGPRDDFDSPHSRLVPHWIQQVVDARETGLSTLKIARHPDESDRYLFVRDAARAVVMAANTERPSQPLWIGSDADVTNSELMGMICDLCAFPGSVHWTQDGRPQQRTSNALCWQTTRLPGFSPRVSLREGLISTIAWYERHHAALRSSKRTEPFRSDVGG